MKLFNEIKKKIPIGIAFNIILLKKNIINFVVIESYRLNNNQKKNLIEIIKKYKLKYKLYFLKILEKNYVEKNFYNNNKNLIIFKKDIQNIEKDINEKCFYNNKNNTKSYFFLITYNITYNGEYLDYFHIDYCKRISKKIQDKLLLFQGTSKKYK